MYGRTSCDGSKFRQAEKEMEEKPNGDSSMYCDAMSFPSFHIPRTRGIVTGLEGPRSVDRISVPNLDKKMTGLFTRPDMLVASFRTPQFHQRQEKRKPSQANGKSMTFHKAKISWDAWRPRGMKLFLGTVERGSWGIQEADRLAKREEQVVSLGN